MKSDAGNVTKFLQYLATQQDVHAERNNTGAVRAEYKGKERFIRYGVPGKFDIVGWLHHRRLRWAVPFEIEAKRPGGKLNANQVKRTELLEKMNVPYLVADSLEQVREWLEDLRES